MHVVEPVRALVEPSHEREQSFVVPSRTPYHCGVTTLDLFLNAG